MSQSYVLHYWPQIPGRGEFVRLAFEAVKQPYVENNKDVHKLTLQAGAALGHPSHFAVPILEVKGAPVPVDDEKDEKTRHDSVFLSQTGNILNYLAQILGLDGTQSLEERGEAAKSLRRAHVLQLTTTALDLVNETHDTHHPVASASYYEDQKNEAVRRAADFRSVRLPKFFQHFAQTIENNPTNAGWLIGEQKTVADLALFQTVDGLLFAFPKRTAALKKSGQYDQLFALHAKVANDEAIAQYLKSDRRKKYSMGIFRHYPELDGDE